jgi:hypothetical protein
MTNPGSKIRLMWRIAMGCLGAGILAAEFVGYIVARDLNRSYFNSPPASLALLDGVLLVVAAYLIVVAISGRWLGLPLHS